MTRTILKIVGLCLGIALLTLGIVGILRSGSAPAAESETSSSAAPREAGWVVGAWEGRLAVFPAGASEPSEVYDVYLASLPPEEQQRLTAGIVAPDRASLASLLEDYTS